MAHLSHEYLRQGLAQLNEQKPGQRKLKILFARHSDDNFTSVRVVFANVKAKPHEGELLFAENQAGTFDLERAKGVGSPDLMELFRKQTGLQFSIAPQLQTMRRLSMKRSLREMELVNQRTFTAWRDEAYPDPTTRPQRPKFIIMYSYSDNAFFGVKAVPYTANIEKPGKSRGFIYVHENPGETYTVEDVIGAKAHTLAKKWHELGPSGIKIAPAALAAKSHTPTSSASQAVKAVHELNRYCKEAYGKAYRANKAQRFVLQISGNIDGPCTIKAFTEEVIATQDSHHRTRITVEKAANNHYTVLTASGRSAAELMDKWRRQNSANVTFSQDILAMKSRSPSVSERSMRQISADRVKKIFQKRYHRPLAQDEEVVLQFRLHKGRYLGLTVILPSDPYYNASNDFGKIALQCKDENLIYKAHRGLGARNLIMAWYNSRPTAIVLPNNPEDVPKRGAISHHPAGFTTVATLTDLILGPMTWPAKLSWQTVRTALTHPLFRESAGFVTADTAAKLITGHVDEIDFKQSAKMMAVDSAIRTPSRAILADFLPKAGAARNFMLSNFPTVLTMAVMDYSASGSIHPLSYAENLPLMGMGNLFGKAVTAWLQESFAFAKFAGSFASFTAFFVLADFKQRTEQAEALAISTAQLANALKSSIPEQSKLQQYIQQRLISSSAGSQLSALLEKIANATEKPDEELENIVVYDVQRLLKRPSCWSFPQLLNVAEQKNKVAELRQVYLEAATQRAAELQKEIDELVTNSTDEVEGKLYQPLIRIELENALDQLKLSSAKRYADTVDTQIVTLAVGLAQNLRHQVFATQLQTYEAQLTQLQQDQLRVVHYDCEREQLHPLCQMQNSGKFLREDVAGVEALDWSQQSYTLQESPPEDLSLLKKMNVADALLFMKYRGVELFPTAPQK